MIRNVINGSHHFVLQDFGDTLYKYFLIFARPLIYKNSTSVLLFPYCEGRSSDLIILVPGFCSINGFGHGKCSPAYLLLVTLILDFWKIHFIVELWR